MNGYIRPIWRLAQERASNQEAIRSKLYWLWKDDDPKYKYLSKKIGDGYDWIDRLIDKLLAEKEKNAYYTQPTNKFMEIFRQSYHRDSTMPEFIEYTTDNIEFEGLGLGPFEIVIPLKRPFKMEAEPLDPNYSEEGYPHPHIEGGGHVCLGQGTRNYIVALCSLDVEAIKDVVNSIIETYNPDDAYEQIEDWEGRSYCVNCGEYTNDRCENCDILMCEYCAIYCGECNKYMCGDCGTYDDWNERCICHCVAVECTKCEITMHVNAAEELEDNNYCPACFEKFPTCDMCLEIVTEVEEFKDEEYCSECIDAAKEEANEEAKAS
jgi:hypothetical protein